MLFEQWVIDGKDYLLLVYRLQTLEESTMQETIMEELMQEVQPEPEVTLADFLTCLYFKICSWAVWITLCLAEGRKQSV